MPTKRTRATRKQKGVSQAALAYLLDDSAATISGVDGFTLWCYRNGMPGFDGEPTPDELWRDHGPEFLPEYIKNHPCRRPRAWWHWSAPRQADQGSGWFWEGTLPEPRKKLKGKGELHQGYVPYFEYGIAEHWDRESLDSNDPLFFESQASYLLRHGLLSEEEKKYLAKHPELLEPEKWNFEIE